MEEENVDVYDYETSGPSEYPANNLDEPQHLSEEDIESRLEEIKGKVPSFLIEDLKRNLKGKKFTDKQIDRIVGKITDMYRMRQEKFDSSVEAAKDIATIKNELSDLKREILALKEGVEDILSDLRILALLDIDIESIITKTVAGDTVTDDEPMADDDPADTVDAAGLTTIEETEETVARAD